MTIMSLKFPSIRKKYNVMISCTFLAYEPIVAYYIAEIKMTKTLIIFI